MGKGGGNCNRGQMSLDAAGAAPAATATRPVRQASQSPSPSLAQLEAERLEALVSLQELTENDAPWDHPRYPTVGEALAAQESPQQRALTETLTWDTLDFLGSRRDRLNATQQAALDRYMAAQTLLLADQTKWNNPFDARRAANEPVRYWRAVTLQARAQRVIQQLEEQRGQWSPANQRLFDKLSQQLEPLAKWDLTTAADYVPAPRQTPPGWSALLVGEAVAASLTSEPGARFNRAFDEGIVDRHRELIESRLGERPECAVVAADDGWIDRLSLKDGWEGAYYAEYDAAFVTADHAQRALDYQYEDAVIHEMLHSAYPHRENDPAVIEFDEATIQALTDELHRGLEGASPSCGFYRPLSRSMTWLADQSGQPRLEFLQASARQVAEVREDWLAERTDKHAKPAVFALRWTQLLMASTRADRDSGYQPGETADALFAQYAQDAWRRVPSTSTPAK